MKLSHVADLKTNNPNADFYLVRKGSRNTVGTPTWNYSKEHIAVTVTSAKIDKKYLFYVLMHLHQKGVFALIARGTLNLTHITIDDAGETPIG